MKEKAKMKLFLLYADFSNFANIILTDDITSNFTKIAFYLLYPHGVENIKKFIFQKRKKNYLSKQFFLPFYHKNHAFFQGK
jgi:hypothetical protein